MGIKSVVANNSAACTGIYLQRFLVAQSAALSVTFKEAEEKPTNCSTAPFATPGPTFLARPSQSLPPRPARRTYRGAAGPAGSAGPGSGSSSSSSPSSPGASMVHLELLRTGGQTAGQTAGQSRQGRGELRAGQARLQRCSPRAAVALISCLGAGFGQRSGKEAGAKPRSLQSRQGSN